MTVTSYQDLLRSILDTLTTALYFTRLILSIHFLSFRKPEKSKIKLQEINRLPSAHAVEGVTGEATEILVDRFPRSLIPAKLKSQLDFQTPGEFLDIKIRLTRYRNSSSVKHGPLLMLHGYSVSGTSFAHPSLKNGMAHYFSSRGWDVWVLDFRTSPGVILEGVKRKVVKSDSSVIGLTQDIEKDKSREVSSAELPFIFEDVALADIPIAVDWIHNQTIQELFDAGETEVDRDSHKVSVIAHCMGSAMFSMSVLSSRTKIENIVHDHEAAQRMQQREIEFGLEEKRKNLPKRIKQLAISQVPPTVRFKPDNIFKSFLLKNVVRNLNLVTYQFRPQSEPGLIDRLLYTLPYSRKERKLESPMSPWGYRGFVGTRHRVDALYSKDFNLDNVSKEMLLKIDDFFGDLSLQTIYQATSFGQHSMITNREGHNVFIKENVTECWTFPTYAFHGSENALFNPNSLQRFKKIWEQFGKSVETEMIKGYGHLDCLIGENSYVDVFPKIENFLDSNEISPKEENNQDQRQAEIDRSSVSATNSIDWQLALPSLGPIYQGFNDKDMMPVLIGTHPEKSFFENNYLVTLPVYQSEGGYSPDPVHDRVTDTNRAMVENYVMASGGFLPLNNGNSNDGSGVRNGDKEGGEKLVHKFSQAKKIFDQGETIYADHPLDTTQSADEILLLHVSFPGYFPQAEAEIDLLSDKDTWNMLVKSIVDEFIEKHSERSRQEFGQEIQTILDGDLKLGLLRRPDASISANSKGEISFWVGSCAYPGGIIDSHRPVASYDQMQKLLYSKSDEKRPCMLLLLGDQVYLDATAGIFDPSIQDDRFISPYLHYLGQESLRRVFTQLPVYAMLDDHEIINDWEPEGLSQNDGTTDSQNQLYLKRGTDAYIDFQRPDIVDKDVRDLHFQLEQKGLSVFVCDTRSKRMHRDIFNIDNANMLGESQLNDLLSWLNDESVTGPRVLASPARFLPRDIKCHWNTSFASSAHSDGWDGYPGSLLPVLEAIYQNKLDELVVVCGDIHAFCIHHISIEEMGNGNGEKISFNVVHSSGLNAPLPSTNHSEARFHNHDVFEFQSRKESEIRYKVEIKEVFYETNCNGFANFMYQENQGDWSAECEFHLTRDGLNFVNTKFKVL